MFWLPLVQKAVGMITEDRAKKDAAQQQGYKNMGAAMGGNNSGFAHQQAAGSVSQNNAGQVLDFISQFKKNKPNVPAQEAMQEGRLGGIGSAAGDIYGGENSDQLLGDIGVS